MENILYLIKGQTYTFNIINRFFAEHLPIIAINSTSGTRTNEVTTGVVNTWQTQSGKLYTGAVVYENDKAYSNNTALMPKTELQKLIIRFTPAATGTFYLICGKVENQSYQKLEVSEALGDVINSEELYQTLLIRRTNRLYGINYSQNLLDRVLETYIPAGVLQNITNLEPDIAGFSADQYFYNPDTNAIISATITDPESDILTYEWSQVSPIISVSGIDLTCIINNKTSATCNIDLTVPPVETMYKFNIKVEDSDNSVNETYGIPVYSISGILMFTNWGVTTFMLGDNDLPFSYYN